jgi:transposase
MEATGCYGEALATYLYDQGIEVSVVNPAQIKSFSGAQLKRAKTDKADAKLIAQFYQQMQPDHWTPPPGAGALVMAGIACASANAGVNMRRAKIRTFMPLVSA